jgi:hypothetical protein
VKISPDGMGIQANGEGMSQRLNVSPPLCRAGGKFNWIRGYVPKPSSLTRSQLARIASGAYEATAIASASCQPLLSSKGLVRWLTCSARGGSGGRSQPRRAIHTDT